MLWCLVWWRFTPGTALPDVGAIDQARPVDVARTWCSVVEGAAVPAVPPRSLVRHLNGRTVGEAKDHVPVRREVDVRQDRLWVCHHRTAGGVRVDPVHEPVGWVVGPRLPVRGRAGNAPITELRAAADASSLIVERLRDHQFGSTEVQVLLVNLPHVRAGRRGRPTSTIRLSGIPLLRVHTSDVELAVLDRKTPRPPVVLWDAIGRLDQHGLRDVTRGGIDDDEFLRVEVHRIQSGAVFGQIQVTQGLLAGIEGDVRVVVPRRVTRSGGVVSVPSVRNHRQQLDVARAVHLVDPAGAAASVRKLHATT